MFQKKLLFAVMIAATVFSLTSLNAQAYHPRCYKKMVCYTKCRHRYWHHGRRCKEVCRVRRYCPW